MTPDGGSVVDATGKRVRLYRLTPGERGRVLVGAPGKAQHALLWLTEGGQPVPLTLEAAFRRACTHCHRFGIDVNVTPHTLRHYVAFRTMSHTVTEFCNFSPKLQIVRPKGLAKHAT